MKTSLFAIHRPIFTIMVVLIVILLGIISLLRLPIDLMPDISYPTLSVSCSYKNAGPEEIEELITRPIEIHIFQHEGQLLSSRVVSYHGACSKTLKCVDRYWLSENRKDSQENPDWKEG